MKQRRYKETGILIGTTLAVYLTFKYLLPLVAPFLFSWLLACLLLPAVQFLKRKFHIAKGLGSTVLIAVVVFLIGMLAFGIGQLAVGQLGRFFRDFPVYRQLIMSSAENFCSGCDELFGLTEGTVKELLGQGNFGGNRWFQANALPELSKQVLHGIQKLLQILWLLFLVFLGAFLMLKDSEDLKIIWQESDWHEKGTKLLERLWVTGFAYGKAQMIIMGLTALLCSTALLLIGSSYSLLLGGLIAFLDFLPAIGSGLILLPWTVYKAVQGEWFAAAVLLSVYIACLVMRQLIESKIIGDGAGIKPIFTVIAMYAGVKLFGILGFILGPIAMIVIKVTLQNQW